MRSYSQYCPAALALDLVGDRWTLLVVRELGVRPARYGDLQDALPGIATNLLADRLRKLTGAGVIEAIQLARPASGTVYGLTPWGEELYDIVVRLGRWGGHLLATGQRGRAFQTHYLVALVRGMWGLGGADLDGIEPLSIRISGGDDAVRIEVTPDGVDASIDRDEAPADVTMDGQPEAIVALLAGVAEPGPSERRAAGFRASPGATERFRAWTARSSVASAA